MLLIIICYTFLLQAECLVNIIWELWRKGQALWWGKLSEIHWKTCRTIAGTQDEHLALSTFLAVRCKSNSIKLHLCMMSFLVLEVIIIQKKKQTKQVLLHCGGAAALPQLNRYLANTLNIQFRIGRKASPICQNRVDLYSHLQPESSFSSRTDLKIIQRLQKWRTPLPGMLIPLLKT